jgi:hypothetical protein
MQVSDGVSGSTGALNQLRNAASRWVFSPLQGMTLNRWSRIVGDSGIRIHPAYWPRAALTGLAAMINSAEARREERDYGERVRSTEAREPLFILGHYRSGTTHLHNLMSVDPRFAFANYYQANFPCTFLTSEGFGSRLDFLSPRKRPHDEVRMGLGTPAEDELALCADTLLSPHMSWHFPARNGHYRRYLTLREADAAEREHWKSSLRRFVQKLTVRYGRPIVLKSPCHTARVPLILETFPDARFVHIHRDPFTVYQSTRHMEVKVGPLYQFQRRDLVGLEDDILWRYRRMYDAYLEDRKRIPGGRLTEIPYDRLTRDPIGTLRSVYEALDLPAFDVARPLVERYLSTVNGYKTNRYAPLEPRLETRIATEWRPSFDEWGYPDGSRIRLSVSG